MDQHFQKVRDYVLDLGYDIIHEDATDSMIVINDESNGIRNLVIGCADPILIMEQFILELHNGSSDIYRSLLIKNRDIIHGAFVLDETGKKVIFRDTLQLESLDLNELEGSINSLSVLLGEYNNELIQFSKN